MNPDIPAQTPEVIYQNQDYLKNKLPIKRILLIILAIILITSPITLAHLYVYLNPVQLPISTPKPSPSPKSLVSKYTGIGKSYNSEGFNNCVFQKDKDKLIINSQLQKDGTISVALSGNIMDVQSISDKLTIALISYDGSQGYQFILPKDEQIVLETPQATLASPASVLKTFLSVKVFGVCNPKSTSQALTINQISILEDLSKRRK